MKQRFTQLIAQASQARRVLISSFAVVAVLAAAIYAYAAVGISITGAASYTISADNAATTNTFTPITNVVVREGVENDFTSGQTYRIRLVAPTGWVFSSSGVTAVRNGSGEVTLNTTPTYITDADGVRAIEFSLTANNGNQNKIDEIIITGLSVKSTNGLIDPTQPKLISVQVLNTANNNIVASSTPISLSQRPGAARSLAFRQQPSAVNVGAAITPGPQVAVVDQFGNTVTSATGSIGLALTGTPSTALITPSTGATASISNGVATFSNVRIDEGGNFNLVASYSLTPGQTLQGTSSAFVVNNLVPTVSSTLPCITVGDGQNTVNVTGTGFVRGSVVRINGANRATTFVSSTSISATLLPEDINTARTLTLTVFNPTPAGGSSNAVDFVIHPIYQAGEITGETEVCEGAQNVIYTVEDIAGATFNWQVGTGATIVSGGTSNTITVRFGNTASTVNIAVQALNACGVAGPASDIDVTVTPYPTGVSAGPAEGVAFCTGGTATLGSGNPAADSYTYSWSPATGLSDPTVLNPTVTLTNSSAVAEFHTYTLTVTNGDAECAVTDQVTVTVYPELIVAADDVEPVCVGGDIELRVTGDASYTYAWTGPNEFTSSDQNPVIPNATEDNEGTYTVVVTNQQGCQATATVDVTIAPLPTANAGADQRLCSQGASTSFTVRGTISDGAVGVWSVVAGAATIATPTSLETEVSITNGSATLRFTAETPQGCQAFDDVVLTVDPLPVASIEQGTNTYFCSPGGAVLSAEGPATNSYIWFRNDEGTPVEVDQGQSITVFTEGEYFVVVRDGNTCEATSQGILVRETVVNNNLLESGDQEICFGAIPVAINGSTAEARIGTLSYQWEVSTDGTTFTAIPGATSEDLSSEQLGVHEADRWYRRRAIVGSCTNTSEQIIKVTVGPELALTSDLTPDAVCSGAIFSYTPTSDVNDVTFNWTRAAVPGISNAAASGEGAISETLVNETADPVEVTYTFIVSNEDCEGEPQRVVVTVNPTPQLSSTLTPDAICSGATFSYTPTSATAGAIFSWERLPATGISSPGTVSGSGAISQVLTNNTASPIEITYRFTTTANGCEGMTQDVVVIVNPTPTANAGDDQVRCATAGGTVFTLDGQVSSATGTWTVLSRTGTAAATISNANQLNTNVTVSGTGTVTLRLTANSNTTNPSCGTATDDVVLTVNPLPTASAGADQTRCFTTGGTQFTLAGAVTNSTGTWAVVGSSGGATASIASPSSPTSSVTVTGTGTVTLRLTASSNQTPNCGEVSDDVVLTVNPLPTANAGADEAKCVTGNSTSFTLNGSVANGTGQWSFVSRTGSASVTITNPNQLNTSVAVSGTGTVTLRLTATSNLTPSCGTATDNVVLTVNPLPVVSITAPTATSYCVSAPVQPLTGSPTGGTFRILQGSTVRVNNATSFDPAALGAGTYTVEYTYTNNNTCTNIATKSVTVNPLPATPTVSGIIAGATYFTGERVNGQYYRTLTGSPEGGIFTGPGVSLVNGAYRFTPCDALGSGQNEATVNIVYTIRNASGCESSVSVPVTVRRSTYTVVLQTVPFPVCKSVNTQYTARVLRDAVVTYPNPADIRTVPISIVDEGEDVSDLFTIQSGIGEGNNLPSNFNRGASFGNSSLSSEEFYISRAIPRNNVLPSCASTATILSNRIYLGTPNVDVTMTNPGSICPGTSVTFNASTTSVSPGTLSYQWTVNGQPIKDATEATFTTSTLQNGDRVAVSFTAAGSGCGTATSNNEIVMVVVVPQTVTASNYCAGTAGASVTIESSQVGVNYQLVRIAGDGTTTNIGSPIAGTGGILNFGNRTAGTYSVVPIAFRPGACDMFNQVTINETPLPTAFDVTGGGRFCTNGSGVPVGLSGSQVGVNYHLRRSVNGGAATNVGTPVAGTGAAISFGNQTVAGTYTVEATSVVNETTASCSRGMTGSAIIIVDPLPTVTVNSPTTCENAPVTVTAVPSGGTGPYTYTWTVPSGVTNPGNVASFQTAVAGTYTVRVTDSRNCASSAAATSTVTVNPRPTVSVNSPTVCAGETATVIASAAGGVGPYTYTWIVPSGFDNPGNVASFPTTVAGTYSVIVTDSRSCASSEAATSTVTVNPIRTSRASLYIENEQGEITEENPILPGEWLKITALSDIEDEGAALSYEWSIGNDVGNEWNVIKTNREGFLIIDPVEPGEFNVRVLITPNNNGVICFDPVLLITTEPLVPLPVEIIYFTAAKQGNNVLLEWATASEENNTGFEVQVSQDGFNFRKLDFVPTKNGNTVIKQVYQYTDKENGKRGTRYYRLKQLDEDGRFEYFTTKAVTFSEVASKVKAFPNPFTTKITLDIAAENSGQVQVTMWNAVGRQLMEQTVVVEEGFNTVSLNVRSDLTHGVYFLRVYLDGKMHQIKMLRE